MSDEARRIERGSLTVLSESHVITLTGEMDGSSAKALEEELLRLEATGAERIVLDLSRLQFIESTGLAVILRAHRRTEKNRHSLSIVRPQGQVGRAFELSGLDEVLSFRPLI
jgi:anti-sigma B factor antagonist